MSVSERFQEALNNAMDAANVSADQLAEAVGISRAMVYKYKRGESVPRDLDRLAAIESTLKLPDGELRRIIVGEQPDISHLDVSDLDEGQRRELAGFLKGLRARRGT